DFQISKADGMRGFIQLSHHKNAVGGGLDTFPVKKIFYADITHILIFCAKVQLIYCKPFAKMVL
ncbi:MAG: hypothetical protein SPE72_03285, partial [Alloprevotella sp.]|nr:hypothetical protein [Alloprevotella sp.]